MSDFDKYTFAVDSIIAPCEIRVVKCRVRDLPNSSRPYVELESGDMAFVESRFIFDAKEKAEAARKSAVIDMFESLQICWNCGLAQCYPPDIFCNEPYEPEPCPEIYDTCKHWKSREESEATE